MDASAQLGPAEAAFASGVFDQVVVLVWRGAPTRPVLDRAVKAYQACVERCSGPVAYLSVMEENSGPPETRDLPYIAGTLDRIEGMEAVALVLEGRDPWMPWAFEAAMRITAATTRRRPLKLCLEPKEAIAWLVARRLHHAPDDVFRDGLSRTVERVREQLDRWPDD